MSALILAESEGHKLSARELYSMIMLLIVAGHENDSEFNYKYGISTS